MATLILPAHLSENIDRAALLLQQDGIVAFATETVYGLGAVASSKTAIEKIFEAKKRPLSNPLIVHVASLEQAWPLWDIALAGGAKIQERIELLVEKFWPGPLTIVCEKSTLVSDLVTAGNNKVAVRMPASHSARSLIERVGKPLVAPSANSYMRPSPTCAEHVLRTLDGQIDAVLDDGPSNIGIESTVLDVSASQPLVLRLGAITLEHIRHVLPETRLATTLIEKKFSPGTHKKHYAPAVRGVQVIPSVELASIWTSSASIIIRADTARYYLEKLGPRSTAAFTAILPEVASDYAQMLYQNLYDAEKHAGELLYIEELPAGDSWDPVRDKLERAAA